MHLFNIQPTSVRFYPKKNQNTKIIIIYVINKKMGNQICNQTKSSELCDICCQEDDELNFVTLNQCGHSAHIPCLHRYLENLVNSNSNLLQVKCPVQGCKVFLKPYEILQFLKMNQKNNYLKLAFQAYILRNSDKQNVFQFCPTPDCQAVYQFHPNDISDCKALYCRVCKKSFCTSCKQRAHPGKKCHEYDKIQDELFQSAVKEKKFQKCPNCRTYIEKVDGCNHITCNCGAEFCYVCGKNISEDCEHLKYFEPQLVPFFLRNFNVGAGVMINQELLDLIDGIRRFQ